MNPRDLDSRQWLLRLLEVIDRRDEVLLEQLFAPNSSYSLNNEPQIVGSGAISIHLGEFWRTFIKIEHGPIRMCCEGQNLLDESDVTNSDRFRLEKVCKEVIWVERDEAGLATSLTMYSDLTPLFPS